MGLRTNKIFPCEVSLPVVASGFSWNWNWKFKRARNWIGDSIKGIHEMILSLMSPSDITCGSQIPPSALEDILMGPWQLHVAFLGMKAQNGGKQRDALPVMSPWLLPVPVGWPSMLSLRRRLLLLFDVLLWRDQLQLQFCFSASSAF